MCLSLLAFLLLLVLTLAFFLWSETQSTAASRDQEQARQNALAGFEIALGKLQEMAGPDARITAPSDVLPSTAASNKHWTGIWNATAWGSALSAPAPIGWLISGTTPDPATALPDPAASEDVAWAVLPDASSPTSDIGVKVPLMNAARGKLGYWVGEENTKANIAIAAPENPTFATHFQEIDGSGGTSTSNSRITIQGFRADQARLVSADRSSVEFLDDSLLAQEIALPATQKKIGRALSTGSLEETLVVNLFPKHLHDFTLHSASVLTDVPRGRLRSNASAHAGIDGWFAFWGSPNGGYVPGLSLNVDNYWEIGPWHQWAAADRPNNNPGNVANRIHQPVHTYGGYNSNNDSLTLRGVYGPLVTEAVVQFSIYRRPGAGPQPLMLRYGVEVELWNPYNAYLFDVVKRLAVRFEGLPTIQVTTGSGQTFDVNLDTVMNHETRTAGGSDLGGTAIAPQAVWQVIYTVGDNSLWSPGLSQTLAPGEVRVHRTTAARVDKPWTTQIFPVVRERELTDNGASFVELPLGFNEPDTGGPLTVSVPACQVRLEVSFGYNKGYEVNTPNAPSFGKPNSMTIWPQMSFSATTATSSDISNPSWLIGFGFEMKDDLAGILATQDPRTLNYSAAMLEPVASSGKYSDDPVNNTTPISGGNASNRYFYSGNPGFVLFELNRDIPTSVGQLQNVVGNQTYRVGSPTSPNAHTNNWYFDSLFYSSVPNAQPPVPISDTSLLNPHVRYYSDDKNPILPNNTSAFGFGQWGVSARFLMVNGGFNLNSTSEKAWELMLSGINRPNDPASTGGPWEHRSGVPGNPVSRPLERAFLRFPKTSNIRMSLLSESTLRSLSGTDLEEAAFLPQVRELTSTETAALAAGVVAATKSRSQPWKSIQEFVDAGVLARLLDPDGVEGSVNVPPVTSINETFKNFKHAPIYLTQQDILTQIAPLLNVRSDTFVIRGYGDTRAAANGKVLARARCEAIVQRVPTPFKQDVALTASDTDKARGFQLTQSADPFGRRFRVISFRWLPNQVN